MTSSLNKFLYYPHIQHSRSGIKTRAAITAALPQDYIDPYYDHIHKAVNVIVPPTTPQYKNYTHHDYRGLAHVERRTRHFNATQTNIRLRGGSIADLAAHKAVFDQTGQCTCPPKKNADGQPVIVCNC